MSGVTHFDGLTLNQKRSLFILSGSLLPMDLITRGFLTAPVLSSSGRLLLSLSWEEGRNPDTNQQTATENLSGERVSVPRQPGPRQHD